MGLCLFYALDKEGRYLGDITPISKKLPPPMQVLRTCLSHVKRIIWTALIDPATNHCTDRIVSSAPWRESAFGVEEHQGFRESVVFVCSLRYHCQVRISRLKMCRASLDIRNTSPGSISDIQDRIVSVTQLCSLVPGTSILSGSIIAKALERVRYLRLVDFAMISIPVLASTDRGIGSKSINNSESINPVSIPSWLVLTNFITICV